MGKWLRRLRLFAISIAILIAIAFVVLQTALFKDWLLRRVIALSGDYVDGHVNVARLSGPLFGGLRLTEVSIEQPAGTVLHIASIDVQFGVMALLRRDVVISRITIEGAAINVVEDQRGWNVAHILKEQPKTNETASAPWAVHIGTLTLKDALVHVQPMNGVARTVTLNADGNAVVDSYGVRASLAKLDAGEESTGVILSNGRVDVDMPATSDVIAFHTLFKAHQTDVDAHGTYDPVGTVVFASVRNFDMRHLPGGLGLPGVATTLNANMNARVTAASWSIDTEFLQSTVEGAEIVGGARAIVASTSAKAPLTYSFRGGLRKVNVAPIQELFTGKRGIVTNITGQLNVDGSGTTLADVNARVRTTLEPSRIEGIQFGRLQADARLNKRAADVTVNTTFNGLPQSIVLPETLKGTRVAGAVNAHVMLPNIERISVETASGAVKASLKESVVAGTVVKTATVDATLDRGFANIAALHLDGPAFVVDAKGQVAMGDKGTSNLTYVADVTDASAIAPALKLDLKGAGRIEGEVSGNRANLRTTGSANLLTVAYGDTASALTAKSTFDVTMPNLDAKQLVANGELDSSFIKASSVDLDHVKGTFSYKDGAIGMNAVLEQADRSVALNGTVRLEADQSTIALRSLGITAAKTTWTMPEGQESRAIYRGGIGTIDGLTLINGVQRVSIKGSIGVDAPAPQPLHLNAENVSVADLRNILLIDRPVEGVLNVEAEMTGTVKAPNATAKLTVTQGKVAETAFQQLAGNVIVSPEATRIDLELAQTPAVKLTAKGTLPSPVATETQNAINVDVNSNGVDLALIESFTAEVSKVAGTATMAVKVTGTTAAPVISGDVAIAEGAFDVAMTGVRYEHWNADVSLSAGKATIKRFEMKDSDGNPLTMTGTADVIVAEGGERQVAIKAVTNQLRLLRNEFGNVNATATLNVAGPLTQLDVTGTVRLSEGRIELDRLLETATKNPYSTASQEIVQKQADAKAAAAAPSMYDTTNLRADVQIPDNLVIRGRDLRTYSSTSALGDINITVGGTLRVEKPRGMTPTATGTLQAVRGFYQFQGRRFEVERGSEVRLVGDRPINPILQLSANREISGVTARVTVTGTMDKPELRLSSTPALDEGDILSMIVFNQPMNALNNNEKVSLSQRAGAMALGSVTSPIANSVARAFNLDLVDIVAPDANGQGGALSLGRQLSDRLYVNFQQQFGRGDTSHVSFEYRLTEALRLVTTIAQGQAASRARATKGTSGFDFVYFIRY